MNDSKKINEEECLIREQIVKPLENLFNGEITHVSWMQIEQSARFFNSLPETKKILHESLQGLYWEYLTSNIPFAKGTNELNGFLRRTIGEYDGLGEWIGNIDIMELVEELLRCKEPAKRFLYSMDILLRHGYAGYISKWNKQYIEEEIDRLAVQNDRKRGELFCVMLAHYSIATNEGLSDNRRLELHSLLYEYWQFLVNVYSVMVKRIVGSGFKNFLQLVNNVNVMATCHPFLHLFYNAVLLRQDDIFPTDKDKDKAVKNITRMEDIMKETPREDILDELCNILFGKDFEEHIARNKQLTYDEIVQQLEECHETIQSMERNWTVVVNRLRTAIEASVPISVIEKELLMMEPHIAMSIFSQLNTMLMDVESWTRNAKSLKKKLMDNFDISIKEANVNIAMVRSLENNGTFNNIESAYMTSIASEPMAMQIPIKTTMKQ